jgi:predicted ribosome quality control (RQC) complex YloA/Tae2 family protein
VHNNFYFLRQLSSSLETILLKSVISECFTQNKNELMLRFETHTGSFYIRASVQPAFSCLSFAREFNRARKNSVDLFGVLIGQRVLSVRQFNNERSFALLLTNDFVLTFKMHASRSNILLFEKDRVMEMFRTSIESDRTLSLTSFDRDIDWSFESFEKNENNPQQLYFTFGKVVWQYLDSLGFKRKAKEEKWRMIQTLKSELETPSVYYISLLKGVPHLVLFRYGEIVREVNDPVTASNEIFYRYAQEFSFAQEKNQLLSILRARIRNGENYIAKNQARLAEIHERHDYKILADLIMANMHAIGRNANTVTVANFYHNNEPIEIKLKGDLTAQKNAEAYYRKSKKQHLEIEQLQRSIEMKQKEIENLNTRLTEIETSSDFSQVRRLAAELRKTEKQNQPETLPYHEFEKSGFKIWVGKNAESNDTLTLRFAHKEDLWLHAKDVAGSHVVIKHQSGKNFPKDVIERAAQLAAYNSKRKTETLAPVIYTPKKYVRKRKGDPAGMVVVEREKVIMVEPRL